MAIRDDRYAKNHQKDDCEVWPMREFPLVVRGGETKRKRMK